MIVNLEVTDVQVNPELNLANLVVTPTFSSGEGFAPIQTISKNGVNIPPIGGNVNIEVPTKTSEIENDSDFINESDLLPYQLKNDETLETTDKAVVGAINEVNAIAKEKQNALSFFDYEALIESLKLNDSLTTGQSIYLEKLNIPDLWVSHNDNVFNNYTYTNDDDFLVDILSGVAVGIYSLWILETGKVDLTNYYTKSQTDTLIALTAKLSGGNNFEGTQNIDGRINHRRGDWFYSAVSKTEDTVNDTRWRNLNGVEIHQVCTAGSVNKEGGTWVQTYRVDSQGTATLWRLRSNTDLYLQALSGYLYQFGSGGMLFETNQGEAFRLLQNLHLNYLAGKYRYEAASPTSDTINDTRSISSGGIIDFFKCSFGSIVKGAGTWVAGVLRTGHVIETAIPEYADNASALSAGLTVGMKYRTGDLLKIVH